MYEIFPIGRASLNGNGMEIHIVDMNAKNINLSLSSTQLCKETQHAWLKPSES